MPKISVLDTRLVHHPYRGLQYGCNDYVEILNVNHISIPMTQSGDTLGNAIAERVNGILKDEFLEEVYDNFEAALNNIAIAISTYNHLRPHGSIEMLTPSKLTNFIDRLKELGKTTIKERSLVWYNFL
jgi:putative transposase